MVGPVGGSIHPVVGFRRSHPDVITGAARGIGRAAAHRLAGLGARTVIWDIDGEVAEQTATELRELLSCPGQAS
jgi:NAD(P)-dependent dehydrogenase (short-subunit alcohol dehydrogenase family)